MNQDEVVNFKTEFLNLLDIPGNTNIENWSAYHSTTKHQSTTTLQ